jgi:hypothetical protein
VKYLKRGLIVAHPLLFAIFFVLALYSANAAEVSPSEIIIPLFAAMGFALLVIILALLLIGLIRKLQKPQESSQPYQIWDIKKAAIVATIFLILFFTFGFALRALGGWDDMHRTVGDPIFWLFLSLVWVALLTCGAYFTVTTRRDLHKLTSILSIVAISLVIIPTISIVVNEFMAAPQDTTIAENTETNKLALANPDTLPDIYYIVFDRYANARTLKEVYDFDNSEFLDYLSDKGFYVANESAANYQFTAANLASSLNMDFIHEEAAEEWTGSHPSREMLRDNLQDYKVWRLLESVGYQYIHFGSWWETTRENQYADMNINYYSFPEFSWFLFQTTWAFPVFSELNIIDSFVETQYKRVLYKFDKLAEIPQIEEPTFVFAHMLVPHPPYVFDSDGSSLTAEENRERSIEVLFVDQLIATNNMLKVLIDELLSGSDVPPIIILQADEGPYPGGDEEWFNQIDFENATKTELREKYGILNAYYLPNIDANALYSSITPVNSFRLIFNLYFETDFNLLPDKSYVSNEDQLYEFSDVTDKIKYD